MTKLFRALVTGLVIAVLSACGGGGGSAGNTTGAALFTTASTDIVLLAGDVQTYSIGGGVPAYTATSNSSIVVASVNGKVLTLKGVGSGSAIVVVTDSAGAKVQINVKADSGVALFTTAPDNLSIGIGKTSFNFTIGGGSGIYTVAPGNRQVLTINQNGNQFSITGLSAGQTSVTITDSLGNSKKVEVTVGTGVSLFTTAPTAVTVAVGSSTSVYTIGGGSEQYAVSSSDSSVATVGQSNANQFVINGKAGGRATVVVKDSLGNLVNISVVVGSNDAIYSTSGSTVSLNPGGSALYKVGGGTTVYNVGSSNTAVATASITGGDLLITGVSTGTANIIVRDTSSGSLTIAVSVGNGTPTPLYSTAASDIIVLPGSSPTFTIGGGRAPYFVSTSNANVATASVTGSTLTINSISSGTTKVVITDSVGATLTINATVGAGASIPLFTSAPSAVTITAGSTVAYSIGGGTSPYTVTSSNTSAATISATGSTYSVTGGNVGSANIVIRDAVGATVTVAATITGAAQTPVDVLPGDSTGAVGDTLSFNISGGTSPFTILNNNPSIATVTQNGGSFTAKLLNQGATVVTVTDKQGQFKKITITANAAASQLRISPSALTVGEDSTNSIDLTIYGGTGPYRAFTSDLTLSSVPSGTITQSASGTALTIGLGSNGTRCVTVKDTGGTILIGGTYDMTITVIDSLGASATATLTLKDNAKGIGTDKCGN
ncbi:MAG: hypothetical protein E6Q34_05280 [Burkholderiaceae bacterium]|nr:MAG: hypothetical protein E6Q34_05280 [Burkholderiaceae bacterium]